MAYLGTKPSNSPLTSELIPNSIITNAKINDVAATKLTGQVPDANAPSGSVIQVVQGSLASGTWSTTSGSFVDTGLVANITPSSTSNKVLVIFTGTIDTNQSVCAAVCSIYRNGSSVASEVANQYTASGGYLNTTVSFCKIAIASFDSFTSLQYFLNSSYDIEFLFSSNIECNTPFIYLYL
jgi:hypothetical protein